MLEKIARLIDGLLGLVAGLVAAALLLYGGWALYDGYNTNRNALSDPELIRYRPTEDAGVDLVKLRAVNPDVVGWITLDDTDIDYPVLQGADDMTYVNRDVYGRFSLSGSIYLAAACAGDFSDPYSLIYGHHMENGAMFGGLDRFADPAYLQGHTSGHIQTADGGFELRAFACVKTDAYEALIYDVRGKTFDDLEDYIRAHAVAYDGAGAASAGSLVALSTCADIDTNGRLVLFLKATPRAAPVAAAPETARSRDAGRSETRGDGWALLNLACALLTLYTLLPLGSLRVKYRQIGYARGTARRLDAARDGRVIRDLRRYARGMAVGVALEGAAVGAAGYLFYRMQDMRRGMVIIDRWTPWMIGVFALALLVDYICFRYRGMRPKEDPE